MVVKLNKKCVLILNMGFVFYLSWYIYVINLMDLKWWFIILIYSDNAGIKTAINP